MTSKHTPGPWVFRQEDGVRTIFADGKSMMGDAVYYPWCPENAADWRLIAAAPELLEALERLMVECDLVSDNALEAYTKARAAIAKATGETQ